jgi:hypothetical protein
MQRPKDGATNAEWREWADKNYPFDGFREGRKGFEVLRSMEDRDSAAMTARFVARGLPPEQPDALQNIPPLAYVPPRDWRTLPVPEQGEFSHWLNEHENKADK